MFNSAEVRWFRPGPVPEEVMKWFRSVHAGFLEQPARTDYYLALPGSPDMSIKFREEQLEFKQAYGEKGLNWTREKVSGRIAHWQKWSFPLQNEAGAMNSIAVYSESWKKVLKQRSIILFQASDSGLPQATSASILPENGCGLEITRVELPEQKDIWWTLGLEAFGREDKLMDMLSLVAELVFSLPGCPELKLIESMSYPEWLAKM